MPTLSFSDEHEGYDGSVVVGGTINLAYIAEEDELEAKIKSAGDVQPAPDVIQVELDEKPQPDPISGPSMKNQARKSRIGIVFTLLLALFTSLTPLITKLVIHIHPITQTIYRQIGTTLCASILVTVLKCKGDNVFRHLIEKEEGKRKPTVNWKLWAQTIVSALVAVAVTLCRSTAFLYLTIGDGTVLTKIYIIYALLLAHFFLGEKCSIVQSILAAFVLVGVVIIAKPPFLTGQADFTRDTLIGLCLKLGDGFFQAISAICIRHLRQVHFGAVILIFGLVAFVTVTIVSNALGMFLLPTNLTDSLYLAGLGLCHFSAQVCQILALKYEHVGVVSLVQTMDVVFVFIWQITILHVAPDIWTIVGSLLVVSSVAVSSLRKIIADLPKSSPVRKRCAFLLY